jgi:purine-cytosine permease-like protein
LNAVRNVQGLGVEARSIDYVPAAERHGKVIDHGKFWFLSNFQFYSIALGFIGPSMQLSFAFTVLAAVLGVLSGTLFTAFHASQGPELGLPQMIQSRAQFGYRGVIIPLFGSLFTFVGFNVVDTILISQGLHGVFGWNQMALCVVLAIGGAAIAIYGYDWLHLVFRLLFWLSLPLYLVLSIAIGDGSIQPRTLAHAGFEWVAFAAQFTASFAYNITYAPCVSDYTRYLPKAARPAGLVANVYGGASISALWLIVIGAWMGSYLGESDGLVGLAVGGNEVFAHFGTILALVSAVALAATMGMNAYSAMLTVLTSIDSFVPIRPTRQVRVVTILAIMAIWFGIAIALNSSGLTALYASLSLALYLLLPWTAVNLMDYFFVRRGQYRIQDLFCATGIYGTWGWRGISAYGVGFLASIPFFVLSGYYEGPLARAIGGVDISWVPGLLVSALSYYALTRSLDLVRESAAVRSDAISA